MPIAQAILTLISVAPQAITEILALYNAVKADLSSDDQVTIDAALAASQASDAKATEAADAALDDAAKA